MTVEVPYARNVSTHDATGEIYVIWHRKAEQPWSPRAWSILDCDAVLSGKHSCLDAIWTLLADGAVEARGSMSAVTHILPRIWNIISGLSVSQPAKRAMSSHCVIRLFRGKPSHLQMTSPPYDRVPTAYLSMIEASDAHATYIPAQMLWFQYPGAETTLTRQLRLRHPQFKSEPVEYVDAALGLYLDVEPHVFIPDPAVVDLLISAYVSPASWLKRDLSGAHIAEPCTGSGILGIAAAAFGAAHVASSDIDRASVRCAQWNVERAGLQKRVQIEWADGMPVDHKERLFLTNPPWYDDHRADEPAYFQRCLADPERRLLTRLLADAATRGMTIGYVFVGVDDPLRCDSKVFMGERRMAGWHSVQTWKNLRGAHLHRLQRD